MITIDLICEACGEANPPGTEFCRNCNGFLAWDSETANRQPSTASVTATGPAVPTQPVEEQAMPTVEQVVPPEEQVVPTEGQSVPIVEQAVPNQVPVDPRYADTQAHDQQAQTDLSCPYCGTVNPPTRRFCTHCGYSFVAESGTDGSVDWSSWTPQAMAARDREARKAYRRSLPPLYRWRRVVIAVVGFAMFVGLGALLSRNPVALARDGWHKVNNDYVTVAGVRVRVDPAEATVPGSDPASLLDGTEQEWTMAWSPTGSSTCGAAPGTATVVFTFPATQIRRVVIASGLAATNPQRPTQPRPAEIGIAFDDGPCHAESLIDDPKEQVITIDSGRRPVTQMTLGIASAHQGGAASQQISLTEVWIQAYPSP